MKGPFIDVLSKKHIPTEHEIMLYNTALVPIIATSIKTVDKNNLEEQEDDIVENIRIAEEAHHPTTYTCGKTNYIIA